MCFSTLPNSNSMCPWNKVIQPGSLLHSLPQDYRTLGTLFPNLLSSWWFCVGQNGLGYCCFPLPHLHPQSESWFDFPGSQKSPSGYVHHCTVQPRKKMEQRWNGSLFLQDTQGWSTDKSGVKFLTTWVQWASSLTSLSFHYHKNNEISSIIGLWCSHSEQELWGHTVGARSLASSLCSVVWKLNHSMTQFP